MRNLIPFPDPSFQVLEDAVNRKTDQASKNILNAALPTIRLCFAQYDQLFNVNLLETIIANVVHDGIKAELKAMYSYDNTAISTLRKYLEQLQPKSIRYTCQYCSLETAEEMDHIVSQEEFPEFSIHPKNLMPVCSKCNRKKGKYWRTNNIKNVLNMYLDILPQVRYLVLDVFIDQYNELDFNYRLKYDQTIENVVWQLIKSHYLRMDLRIRMKKEAIKYFTEFQARVRNQLAIGQSKEDITEVTISTAEDIRHNYGANHWKAVFEEGLINSPNFWNTLYQQ